MALSDVPAAAVAPLFRPERPGPLIQQHAAATGLGRCRADATRNPRTAVVELPGGNVACRGEPLPVPGLRGLVEAPAAWVPALREVAEVAVWDRIVAVLPADVDVAAGTSRSPRRLTTGDAGDLQALDPSVDWISHTWGGPAGLAASGMAWAAHAGGVLAAVACSFFVGTRYEEIGVVTQPGLRGRGLATATAAALVGDIRARGRQPSWTTSPDNAGSLAVARRLGFVHARDDVLYAVGVPVPAP